MSKLYRLHKQYSPISTKSHCSICLYASALPTVHIKRKAPAFPIRTKQKIMSFFSLITPQFPYIDLYLWRKTRLKVSLLHECPVLCIRIFSQGDAVGLKLCCPFRALWLAESHMYYQPNGLALGFSCRMASSAPSCR